MELGARRNLPLATSETRGRTRRWSVPTIAALAVLMLLLLAQLGLGYAEIAKAGGIERYIRERADFRAILTGGLTIYEGDGQLLYDEEAERAYQRRVIAPYPFERADQVLPNSHPPFESLLIAPLMGQPYAVSFVLWTALEIVALVGALWLLARSAPVAAPTRALLIAGALAYQPFHAVLWTGQSSPLVLLGLCGIRAALALVLLKPQLAVAVVVLLLLARQWRPLLGAAALWAGASVAIMPIVGVAWPLRYARYLAGSAAWGEEHFEYVPGMYNWRGFVQNILGERAPSINGPLTIALIVATLALIAWAWWHSTEIGRGKAAIIPDPLWALVGIATVLIPQHLYPHDLTLLIFPAWLIVAAAATAPWPAIAPRLWLGLVSVGFALPLLIFLFAARTAQAVIPSVALLTLALGLLAFTIGRTARHGAAPTALPPVDR